MHYGKLNFNDIANGEGVRVSLFVSGCRHHCKNCFNREAWDFSYGAPYPAEVDEEILQALQPTYVAGLSLLGGEPFEPENQEALLALVKRVKQRYPEKNIWCYTGFLWEAIVEGAVGKKAVANELLSYIDVLVDGKFVEEQKDLSLLFRGSANQRILDVGRSLAEGQAVWLAGTWQRNMGSGNIYDV